MSTLTSVDIAATQYINIFDITSTLLFLHIMLTVDSLKLKLWPYRDNCTFKNHPWNGSFAKTLPTQASSINTIQINYFNSFGYIYLILNGVYLFLSVY